MTALVLWHREDQVTSIQYSKDHENNRVQFRKDASCCDQSFAVRPRHDFTRYGRSSDTVTGLQVCWCFLCVVSSTWLIGLPLAHCRWSIFLCRMLRFSFLCSLLGHIAVLRRYGLLLQTESRGLSVTILSPAKTAELIEMPYRMCTWMRKEACIRWGSAHWLHMVYTIEPSLCGGGVALCQITLTTCSISLRSYSLRDWTSCFPYMLTSQKRIDQESQKPNDKFPVLTCNWSTSGLLWLWHTWTDFWYFWHKFYR